MNQETGESKKAFSLDLLLWRLESLEAEHKETNKKIDNLASRLGVIETSLASYKAVWKFASGVAAAIGAVFALFVKWLLST